MTLVAGVLLRFRYSGSGWRWSWDSGFGIRVLGRGGVARGPSLDF